MNLLHFVNEHTRQLPRHFLFVECLCLQFTYVIPTSYPSLWERMDMAGESKQCQICAAKISATDSVSLCPTPNDACTGKMFVARLIVLVSVALVQQK